MRYCRPLFGVVDEHTEIRLEASTLKEVVSVNILPIWVSFAYNLRMTRLILSRSIVRDILFMMEDIDRC